VCERSGGGREREVGRGQGERMQNVTTLNVTTLCNLQGVACEIQGEGGREEREREIQGEGGREEREREIQGEGVREEREREIMEGRERERNNGMIEKDGERARARV